MRSFLALVVVAAGAVMPAYCEETAMKSVHSFEMSDIVGRTQPLSAYKGKVLLMVNVASKCGFTGQYEGLQKLYEAYKDQGLVVLGFPANDFGRQEPGTNEEIQQFCTTRYGVTFPMFEKISVKGEDQHPLYAFLTSKELHPEHGGKVSWNFNKFLVDGDGNVIGRFGSRDKPMGDKLVQAIEAALKTTKS